MNKKLILFEIGEECRKNIDDDVLPKTDTNHEYLIIAKQKKMCFQKVSKLKLYLPRQNWSMNEMLIYFRIHILKKE